MKKRSALLFFIAILIAGFCVTLFQMLAVSILSDDEIALLRQDKTFWEWQSDRGALKVHYEEKGNGNTHVILLHGFRAHTYTWKKLMTPLSEAGFHVWSIDLIGFGLSDKPIETRYDQDLFVEQVIRFMQEKNIPSAHFVGNSMGGGIALRTALDHAEKVRSLTLISALAYPLSIPTYLYFLRHIDFIWGPFLNPPVIRKCLEEIMCKKELVTDDQVEAYTLPYRFSGGTKASLLTMQHFDFDKLENLHKRFSCITQPLLLVWGDKDSLIPVSHFDRFSQDFPECEKLLLKNCGHIPQEEYPEEVLEILIPFLEKNSKN